VATGIGSTGPYSEQYESSPYPPIQFFKNNSDIFLASTPTLRSIRFPAGFRIKILYAFLFCPVRATCLNHLILLHLMTAFEAVTGMKPLIMYIFAVKICC
jgi:hypothetical protein